MKTNCIIKTNDLFTVKNLLTKFFTKFDVESEFDLYNVTIYSGKLILDYFTKIFNGMKAGELFIGKSEHITGKHYDFNKLESFVEGLEFFSDTICELNESTKLSIFTDFALFDLDTIVLNSYIEDCATMAGIFMLHELLERDENFDYKYRDLVNKIKDNLDKELVLDFCSMVSYYLGVMYCRDFINKKKELLEEMKYLFNITESFDIIISFVDGIEENNA